MAFTIGGKGYVTSGLNLSSRFLRDTWQYDPATDQWIQKADFPGIGRLEGVGMSGIQYGYAGTGENVDAGQVYNDLYQYNPATNAWGTIPRVAGPRASAAAFSIGTTLYIACGFGYKDFWYYPFAH